MSWKSTVNHYSRLSIALHWVTVVLFILIYASIELRGIFPKDSIGRNLMKDAHFMFGLTVFALVWLRLLARTLGVAPKITPPPPAWQSALATLMHWALYALMIGMPVLGYLVLSYNDKPVFFYGLDLPVLTAKDPDFARQIKSWHELGGTLGYWLIGLHAVAGLAHHYLIKDNTLLRMLPERRG
ncbi:cytochrome b [Pseudomonas sp.]|uniref:cytochrome b n=1 Tax=Pseudomonas sp. TaxID=306 RepID=UPI00262E9C59|nr:cytochrome b [Pseudomonas sp.]